MALLASNHRTASAAGPSADAPMIRQGKMEESEVFIEVGVSDKGMELCQVGEFTSSLPFELFDLPDLKDVLSLDTWNFCLTEEEREHLASFLPAEFDDPSTFATALKEVFSGANIFFGNPVAQLFERMKSGLCQPRVAQFREGLKCLQRKEHYHLLRKYHNGMVNSFVEMQKLWEEYPDVEIDGRLEIWRKWKETNVKPQIPKPSSSLQKSLRLDKVGETRKNTMNTIKRGKGTLIMKPRRVLKTEANAPALEVEITGPSLASAEKNSKMDSIQLQKRVKQEEIIMSSEDNGPSRDVDELQPSSLRQNKMVISQGTVQTQCIANLEAVNEEAENHNRKSKRKPVEKELEESALQPRGRRKPCVSVPFPILAFLSSVRRAMLQTVNVATMNNPPSPSANETYSVPLTDIVKRVHANLEDTKVLQAHESLQDLVWGALKVFSSKIAPTGVKGWKPLAAYEKDIKSWCWIGPIPGRNPAFQEGEAGVSIDDWGLPLKVLTKLEEAFATWYKHGEETRQQMVQLQLPPPPVVQSSVDDRDRFRDMRAQKSSITISPSSEDMRAYFRKEEALRYSIPERAFAYTRSDGRRSVVAPLRRGGGKPTSKARDHFMLKPDRPPHVTILCLVRDAAARLPGGVGTRADVCALIRDSQYVVEDVSDAQVNQVVSGALDRLHYERDPCVKFDGERKLWMYLHTDRSEEDFEDDGTSSTKRWKRQKKELGEGSEVQVGGFESASPGEQQDGGGGNSGGGEFNGAIYSAGRAELVYSKSREITSPRVLNMTEDATGMPSFIELPPSMEELNRSSWDAQPSTWNRDIQHKEHEQPDFDTEDDTAAAQRDADAMIGGDGE